MQRHEARSRRHSPARPAAAVLIGIDHDKPRPLRHTPVSDAEFLPNRLWIRFYALPEEADALGAELIDRLETHTAENGV